MVNKLKEGQRECTIIVPDILILVPDWENQLHASIKGPGDFHTMFSIGMLHYQKNMWLSHICSECCCCGCIMTGLWEDRFYNQDHLTATTTADSKHFDLEIAPNTVDCTCTRISGMSITQFHTQFRTFCHLSMGTIQRLINCWKCTWCICANCKVSKITCFNSSFLTNLIVQWTKRTDYL